MKSFQKDDLTFDERYNCMHSDWLSLETCSCICTWLFDSTRRVGTMWGRGFQQICISALALALYLNEQSLMNPKSTSNQSSKSCTVLQYPSRKVHLHLHLTFNESFPTVCSTRRVRKMWVRGFQQIGISVSRWLDFLWKFSKKKTWLSMKDKASQSACSYSSIVSQSAYSCMEMKIFQYV